MGRGHICLFFSSSFLVASSGEKPPGEGALTIIVWSPSPPPHAYLSSPSPEIDMSPPRFFLVFFFFILFYFACVRGQESTATQPGNIGTCHHPIPSRKGEANRRPHVC